jgi:hypothetical protein
MRNNARSAETTNPRRISSSVVALLCETWTRCSQCRQTDGEAAAAAVCDPQLRSDSGLAGPDTWQRPPRAAVRRRRHRADSRRPPHRECGFGVPAAVSGIHTAAKTPPVQDDAAKPESTGAEALRPSPPSTRHAASTATFALSSHCSLPTHLQSSAVHRYILLQLASSLSALISS